MWGWIVSEKLLLVGACSRIYYAKISLFKTVHTFTLGLINKSYTYIYLCMYVRVY